MGNQKFTRYSKHEEALSAFSDFVNFDSDINELQSGCSIWVKQGRVEKAYVTFMEKYMDMSMKDSKT